MPSCWRQLPLLEAGLDSVNISLDTLDPALFAKITARDEFAAVQAGIHAAGKRHPGQAELRAPGVNEG